MYVLKWTGNLYGGDYYTGSGIASPFQKDAMRFETKDSALQEADPATYAGAEGPNYRVGWRVVRLVRRK